MKKLMVILPLLFLFGCSSIPSYVAEKKSENTPSAKEEEVVVEETPVEEPAEEVVVEEPVEDYSDETSAYAAEVVSGINDIITSLDDMSTLTELAVNDASYFFDSDWIMDMAVAINTMDMGVQRIQGLTPPPHLEQSHMYLMRSMEQYAFVVDNYPTAIDNMDSNLIDLCTAALQQGSTYMNKATQLLKATNSF